MHSEFFSFGKLKILFAICLFSATSSFAGIEGVESIYGRDNRIDIERVGNLKIREAAKSVAARVFTGQLSKKKNTFGFAFNSILSSPDVMNVCSDERFASQPIVSDCTGFLVGDDLLATAGHCLMLDPGIIENDTNEDCQDFSWMFDYSMKNGEIDLETISNRNLYSCKKIVFAALTDHVDFALIKLDRKVVGRKPLKLRTEGKVKNRQKVFVLGHPSGLPLKYAGDSKVIGNEDPYYFSANLDTFGGNSGSPVFNAKTYEVEGILVRGGKDYIESEKDGEACFRANTCDKNGNNCLEDDELGSSSEHVNRLDIFVKILDLALKD